MSLIMPFATINSNVGGRKCGLWIAIIIKGTDLDGGKRWIQITSSNATAVLER